MENNGDGAYFQVNILCVRGAGINSGFLLGISVPCC